MEINKYGVPRKRPRTMIARYDEGGILEREEVRRQAKLKADTEEKTPPKPPGWLDQAASAVKGAKTLADAKIQEGQNAVARWLKPSPSITDRAIQQATEPEAEGNRKGGLVKAKPRGVGIARKGHGRAHHG